ncbi:hypothetical protein [Methyloterricola oryzae]|uniref:hypothetical protein n=1 Tax=Methyloterricola oryzae TaxID=1495050 RepID=UPI00069A30E2|nr:hypothetical protein [Methyloterricola oryzae]
MSTLTDPEHKNRAENICARLLNEMHKLGFLPEQLAQAPSFEQASLETSKDPYSGQDTFCLYWKDRRGHRIGEMKFHGDGSFYAEYDVVQPHPKDPRWFVEGVVAWGRDGAIKSEPKLFPALGD